MKDITLRELLEAGCHFGHQVSRWNPKASVFIFGSREGIHIIDLVKTKKALTDGMEFLKNQSSLGKSIVFVGTKRQAKGFLKQEAKRAGVFYISERWIGGLMTNWDEVKKNLDKIRRLETEIQNTEGIFTKSEVMKKSVKLQRLLKFYDGIKDLKAIPDVLFVVDVKREANAINEAKKTNTPVVAIVDTNSDPDKATISIPANDDASGSLKLLISAVADAVLEGKEQKAKKDEEMQEKTERKVKKEAVKK